MERNEHVTYIKAKCICCDSNSYDIKKWCTSRSRLENKETIKNLSINSLVFTWYSPWSVFCPLFLPASQDTTTVTTARHCVEDVLDESFNLGKKWFV